MSEIHRQTALFVTCLVDFYRPTVGMASLRVLERTGAHVAVPEAQTCCGQPAFNNGDLDHARDIARQVMRAFEGFDYVVVPSGSCAGMMRCHYPELFEGDKFWHPRALDLASRVYELSGFLHDVAGFEPDADFPAHVCYHDSCSCLREMGVRDQPRALLDQVRGLRRTELAQPEVCCGFGGTFCVKYPEISTRLASDKVDDIAASGADTVLAADLGCLLNIAGRLSRLGAPIRAYHIAEVLAGVADESITPVDARDDGEGRA